MTLKVSLMTQRNRLRLKEAATGDTSVITSGTSTMIAGGAAGTQAFLTAPEAAALLRLSPVTLSRWRIKGYGPRWTKMGPKRICYALDDLTAFTNAQKRTSTSDRAG
jgi:hypothetical protein